jgi:hypothetical protein
MFNDETSDLCAGHRGRKVEREVKVNVKNWTFSFCVPASSFRRYHSKFSCLNIFPKSRRNKDMSTKQLGYTDIEIKIFTPKRFEGCIRVKLPT